MGDVQQPSYQYDEITVLVDRLLSAINTAAANDRREANLLLSSDILAVLPCPTGVARAAIAADLQRAVNAATVAWRQIGNSHRWLRASEKSPAALQVAHGQWEVAAESSSQVLTGSADVDRATRQGTWSVSSAEGQQDVSGQLVVADEGLAAATQRVRVACEDASRLGAWIMDKAGAMAQAAEVEATSIASWGIQGGSSLFSLNRRTKAVAQRLDRLAAEYARHHQGGEWRDTSVAIGRRFSAAQSDVLAYRAAAGGALAYRAV